MGFPRGGPWVAGKHAEGQKFLGEAERAWMVELRIQENVT